MSIATWQPYLELRPGDGHTVVGNVLIAPDVWSLQLANRRDIVVYLPPSYERGRRRYPVVYMHDGQNLFDRATSYIGEEWQVDETMEALSGEGMEAIVVGISHMGTERMQEFSPPFKNGHGRGDRYLAFLCETLKPMIDRDFRTLPGAAHTAIIGSSMGGLISLYALFARPDVFARAGVMSPALWVGSGGFIGRPPILQFVADSPRIPGRIYLDHGTHEASAARLHRALIGKGYRDGVDLVYVVDAGGRHTESAWARRLPGALRFLLRERP